MAGPNILNFASKIVFLNGTPLTLPSYAGSTPPGTPTAGDLYYNSTGNIVEYYNGTTWVNVGTVSLTGQVLASGDIIVGNGSNLSAAVAVSGDISLSNAGVTAITATSNSTLTTLSALSLPESQVTGLSTTYANVALSNLTSTSINQSLVPSGNNTLNLGSTPNFQWLNVFALRTQARSAPDVVTFGLLTGIGNTPVTGTGILSNSDGSAANNPVSIVSANSSAYNTAAVQLVTGNGTGVNSGNIILTVGSSTATQGVFKFLQTGVPSVSGQVWTASATDGTGYWANNSGGSAITALTGDGTATGPGSAAFTLATVNSNVGSFGSSTSIPSFTVNAKGLITAASGNAVVAPAGTLTGTTLASNVVTSSLTALGAQSQALNMNSNMINNVANPVGAQDAATKNYVDSAISGLTWQGPAKVYSASNVPLTGSTPLQIDGYTVLNNDLIILGAQTVAATSGEYTASVVGGSYTLTSNGYPMAAGDAWLILNGTTYGDSAFVANYAFGSSSTPMFTEFAGPTAYVFTSPLVLTGRTVTINQATTSTNGYLSSTDWNTFNNKQPAGSYITALTGDATASGPGSAALTLATVNSNVGSFAIATITVNAKGLVTAASAATTTGSGAVVLATSPTLVTPVLGAASATSITVSGATAANGGITSTGTLTINANSAASPIDLYSSSVLRGASGAVITETYVDSTTLTDASGPTAVTAFAFTAGTTAGEEITYVIENGATPSLVRIGTIRVTASSDGSNPSVFDMFSESSDCGVTWTATNSGTAISVNYTTTSQGHNRTMRADVKQLRY